MFPKSTLAIHQESGKLSTMKTVAILGASPKPGRYAFIAMERLRQHGHKAIPVNPAFPEILGERCYAKIGDVPGAIDTVTVYLGEPRSTPLIDEIIAANPRRIIFNPGAENPALEKAAVAAGIEAVNGCTLVMLAARTF